MGSMGVARAVLFSNEQEGGALSFELVGWWVTAVRCWRSVTSRELVQAVKTSKYAAAGYVLCESSEI
jgi:hypothetical protein